MEKLAEKLSIKIQFEGRILAELEKAYIEAERKKEKRYMEFSLEEAELVCERIKITILTDDRLIDYLISEYMTSCWKLLETDIFKSRVSEKVYNPVSVRLIEIEKEDNDIEETPKSILKIMDYLTSVTDKPSGEMGYQYESIKFAAEYLIYAISETDNIKANEFQSRKALYDYVYDPERKEEVSDEKAVINIMDKVQKDYPELFLNVADSDITYENFKKRAQEILPTTHKAGSMDQSEPLNTYEAYAMLILFFIYPTIYRRFLSNPASKNVKVPDYFVFESVRESVEDLFSLEPFEGIPSELHQKNILEDTLHIRSFNAVTIYIMELIKEFDELLHLAQSQNTLSTLFILDEMIKDIPNIKRTWIKKYQELISIIDLYSKDKETEELVREVIKEKEINKDGINFAHESLLNLLEKYSSIDSEFRNTLEDRKTDKKDEYLDTVSNEIFKHIVKLYYKKTDDKPAYHK